MVEQRNHCVYAIQPLFAILAWTYSCWKDGKAKKAILDFIETTGLSFVEPADRIATCDNDGTLWIERPMPPQFDFLFRTWAKEAQHDPTLAHKQPYKTIIEKDEAYFQGLVTQDPKVVMPLEQAVAHSWAGTPPEAFDAQVRDFIDTIKHPKFRIRDILVKYWRGTLFPLAFRASLSVPCSS